MLERPSACHVGDDVRSDGFQGDDLDEACERLEGAQGKRVTRKDDPDLPMAPGARRNYEMKWAGPDGVVSDISHTGWDGTS